MDEKTLNIALGVFSGVLTSAFMYLANVLLTKSFIPWYRQIMYKGIDLNGEWHEQTEIQSILLELKQECERITGKATMQTKNSAPLCGIDDIRTFDVTGKVSQRFITLTLHHTNSQRLGIITYLIQVVGDGSELMGESCWYAPNASRITSGTTHMFREKSRAQVSLTEDKVIKPNFDSSPRIMG